MQKLPYYFLCNISKPILYNSSRYAEYSTKKADNSLTFCHLSDTFESYRNMSSLNLFLYTDQKSSHIVVSVQYEYLYQSPFITNHSLSLNGISVHQLIKGLSRRELTGNTTLILRNHFCIVHWTLPPNFLPCSATEEKYFSDSLSRSSYKDFSSLHRKRFVTKKSF